MHRNECGLLKKRVNLETFINKSFVKIYGVKEPHWNSSISSSIIEIRGYNCKRKDRTKRRCLYTYLKWNKLLKKGTFRDLEHHNIECIWLELFMKKAKPLIVGVVYRPSDYSKYLSKLFQDKSINTLSKINLGNKKL